MLQPRKKTRSKRPPLKASAAAPGVRLWFLSYNSKDLKLVEDFESALSAEDAGSRIFFAPKSLRAGGYWLPELAKQIEEATSFVLLVGKGGLGPWQVVEYYAAFDRRVKMPDFPIILLLLDGQPAPGLPFLRQLHWIVGSGPLSGKDVAHVIDAAAGVGELPGQLWRHTAPYRGLAAMTEADSDFFFDRDKEVVDTLKTLAKTPDCLLILLGNSGVGKSSLAQAGVLAALMRQGWPERAADPGPWPPAFQDSRFWCFLTIKPGVDPIRSLVSTFLDTWQFGSTDAARARQQNEWTELLFEGKAALRDLLDATERHYTELGQPKPPCFFLYVDQGEELYVRSEQKQRARFSQLLAQGLSDPRLRALTSLRADFLGALQADEALYKVHHHISVPPLREAALRDVVMRPAELLGARFETEQIAGDLAVRAAEDSVKDAGALPLLSYLLDDMWSEMLKRGDGVLRLPAKAIELGGVLAERANAFVAARPEAEAALKRLFTLSLATVREDGEPTRRRAPRSDFTDEEWRLVSELADHPHRLLITAASEGRETFAEVAHEAIFRRWEKLREWIAQEREFLAWRSGLESARRTWEAAPEASKNDALLMGLTLATAHDWLQKRPADVPEADRLLILLSRKVDRNRKMRARAIVSGLVLGLVLGIASWLNQPYLLERWRWFTNVRPYMLKEVRPYVLTAEAERSLKAGDPPFIECAKDCPEMVVIPTGEFLMGSPKDELGHNPNEEQHKVTLERPIAVGKYEVTSEEWKACVDHGDCAAGKSESGFGGGEHPQINVERSDTKRYVAWLSRLTGKTYRLLSEAEWEYAARAGTSTSYSFGNDPSALGTYAWFDANAGQKTHPVGEKLPNAFGLHDMHGNVSERVEDCYNDKFEGVPTDGSALVEPGCEAHIVRGGSWGNKPPFLRSAYRLKSPDSYWSYFLGFRVARELSR